jgi:hypothetical protein
MLSRASTYLNSVQFSRVLPSSPPPAGGIITDGLFMELDASLYSGEGDWIDNTGNGNNAIINGPTFIDRTLDPANIGSLPQKYFGFDGNNDTMTIAHNSSFSLSTTQQRTMQMWVNVQRPPISPNRMILFGKLSSAFGFDGYWGGISGNATVFGYPVVIATNGTSISNIKNSSEGVVIRTWYLFTFITRISLDGESTLVYVNDTKIIGTEHGTDGYSESNNITIGYLTPPLTGLGQISYLNGWVGDVYFYTRGLSQAEISTNFEATRGRFGV